jgi:class 3 adenylate cyclase
MKDKRITHDLLQTVEVSNTVASVLRNVSIGTSKFLYDIDCWTNILTEICKDIQSPRGLIKFLYPSSVQGVSSVKCDLGGGKDEIAEFEMSLITNPSSKDIIHVDDNYPRNRKGGIKSIIKLIYVGYIKCEVYLFLKKTINSKDYRNHKNSLYHIFAAIDNLIKHELKYYIGQERLGEERSDEVDLDYLFQHNKKAIYMFIDIRNFTPLTEFLREMGGSEVASKGIKYPTIDAILAEYCKQIGNDILQFGRIDKFIGDGVLAIFGDMKKINSDEWHWEAVKAVCTAYRVTQTFQRMREQWEKSWLYYHQRNRAEEIAPKIGVGIHQGEAAFSFFGPEEHKEFSVIGDAVNIAARLESNAGKDQRENILISQPIYYLLTDANKETRAEIFSDSIMKKHYLQLKGKSNDFAVWGVGGKPNEICLSMMKKRECKKCFIYE